MSAFRQGVTTVFFEVEAGQVWIDPDHVAWYVKSIDGDVVHLERTMTTQYHVRDLVRMCRRPNDAPSGPCG